MEVSPSGKCNNIVFNYNTSQHDFPSRAKVKHTRNNSYYAEFFDRQSIRMGNLKVAPHFLKIASWNIEGYSEDKLISLQMTMIRESIDILCLQETHRLLSDYFVSDEDFLIILFGGSNTDREYAGVGFLIAPYIRKSILRFCQKSNRMSCLKLHISGGKGLEKR